MGRHRGGTVVIAGWSGYSGPAGGSPETAFLGGQASLGERERE